MKLKLTILSLMALLILFYFSLPDNKTRLIFCDVGQGDGAMLTLGTFQMLIDSGPKNGKMVECLSKHLPFWDKKIEVVVISHWDSDHSGGLSEIKKYFKVDKVYSNEQNNSSEKLAEFDVIRSDWFVFEVVSAGSFDYTEDNDRSVVGILKVWTRQQQGQLGGQVILFTGDAGVEVEQRLVWRGILPRSSGAATDVLKVSHHGSSTGTSEELMEAIKPDLAVISVGKNSYGHPTKEVLERLEKYNVQIKRTDLDGEVVIEMD